MGRNKVADAMNLLTIIAGFLSGLIGGLGLGGGGVLLLYLTLFTDATQQQAGGINLLFFLPVGAFAIAVYAFKKQIEWKTVFKMWTGGAIGVALGAFLSSHIDTEILSNFFAVGLIIFSLTQLLPIKLLKEKFKKSKQ